MTNQDERNEIFKGALLLVLLSLLVWRYLAAVEEILTPLFLALAIAVVAFTMRVRWARGIAYFVAALSVIWFANLIWQLLFPFLAAFFIAYLTSPIVNALEKRRVPRGLSSFLLILLALGAVAAALVVVVPPVVHQITRLVAALASLPAQVERFFNDANAWLASLEDYEVSPYARALVDGLAPRAQELFAKLFERLLGIVTSFSSLATHIVNIIITPIVTFYLLRDMPKIKRWVREHIPQRYLADADEIYTGVDRVLAGFIRGQFIVSTVEAFLITVGLTAIGVDYALLLGIFAGFANMVPYVGTYIGALPAVVVVLLSPERYTLLAWTLGLFVVINILDGYVLAPRIVGSRVGLHPVVTMIAMLVAAKFFGVIGFLAAVPVTATLKIFAKKIERRYLESKIYTEPADARPGRRARGR